MIKTKVAVFWRDGF